MKKNTIAIIGAALCGFCTVLLPAFAQGTAFTYQGRLNDATNPANGSYDLRVAVYNTLTAGTQQGNLLTNTATGVTNGLFTVPLDFGAGIFNGNARWLEIGVRTNGTGTFTTLAPRQPVLPVPYSIFANTASNVSGTLPATQLSGTIPVAQLPTAVVTNGEAGVNLGGNLSVGSLTVSNNLNLPAT